MMEGFNKITLLGNLGFDPELRHTASGDAVLNIRLATSESWKDKQGNKQEKTEWHRCTVWGKRAEALGRILHKGDRILVEGQLVYRKWEKDGIERESAEIKVSEVKLQGGGKLREGGQRGFGGAGGARGDFGGGGVDREDYPDDDFGSDDEIGDGDDLPF